MTRYKVIYEGDIPEPKVGEQYCDWGIGGRTGYYCSTIKEVHDDHIILRTSAPFRTLDNPDIPDVIDKISMDDYVIHELVRSHIDKTITVEKSTAQAPSFKEQLVKEYLDNANYQSDCQDMTDPDEAESNFLGWIGEQLPRIKHTEGEGFSIVEPKAEKGGN